MKVFNRNLADVALKAPAYLWYFIKCFFIFRQPVRFIRAYVTLQPPPDKVVELRSGLKIHLSDFGHDVVTVFVIFVRKDYGTFPAGKVVVDIGANIGVFALYAAHVLKASRVFAYEPHAGSFACLQRNIRENGLENRISAWQLAVTDAPGQQVRLTMGAGPYNTLFADEHPDMAGVYGATESVRTTNMAEIVRAAGGIDVLKLDCEGSEYDILLGSTPDVLRQVGEIRMEYHRGRVNELDRVLTASGFTQTLRAPYTEAVGNLWYARS